MGPLFTRKLNFFTYLQIFRQIMASDKCTRTRNSLAKWLQINCVYDDRDGPCSKYFRFCLKFTKKSHFCTHLDFFLFFTYLQISYLLLALVIYAYKGMNAADFRYIFKPKIRNFRYDIISAVCLQI